LKNFEGKKSPPDLDAFAGGQLTTLDVPVSRFLLVDDSRNHLPFAFAVTSYLEGHPATHFASHRHYGEIFLQIGALARQLHAITMPGFGTLPSPEHADNAAYIDALAGNAFERFLHYGAEPSLVEQLRRIFARDFDAVVPVTQRAVFAHDDLHPGYVLATETGDALAISGLIDFGNARAHSAVMDLAKTIFICEHMAPGCGPKIREGYGPIDHPTPQAALAFYTMLHRVIMWWWLRRIGVIASADADSELMQALRVTAFGTQH
jgi:aminoglycoside phosphotransferase (APT) family kinase protein